MFVAQQYNRFSSRQLIRPSRCPFQPALADTQDSSQYVKGLTEMQGLLSDDRPGTAKILLSARE